MVSLWLKFPVFPVASLTAAAATKRWPIREAISLHEEVLRERGEPVPDDRVELVEVAA